MHESTKFNFILRTLFLSCVLCFSHSAVQAQTPTIDIKDPGLKNESELSVVIATGNSRSNSLNVKQQTGYLWSFNTVKAQYRMLKSRSGGVESASNWDSALRYERQLSDHFSLYAGESVESDPFGGYYTRVSSEAGAKFQLVKNPIMSWTAETGYRYSNEARLVAPNVWGHYGRLYTLAEVQISKTSSAKVWVEYLPNFTKQTEFLINNETSITAILNSIFSVKTAYLVKYNHSPAPGIALKTDTLFTTSLVAKF